MSNTNTPGVLTSANAKNGRDLDLALKSLVDEHLLPAARKAAGNKQDRVDLQPESVVASVIADELPNAIGRCQDEAHLRARLITAVQHKIIDRLRKGGDKGPPAQFSQRDMASSIAPASPAADPGPRTQVADAESLAQAIEAHDRFREIVLAHAKNPEERIILDEYVLVGKDWADIARSAGLTVDVAKQRLSRRRRGLLQEVCEPLRAQLDGESWAVAEGVIVERRSPAALAASLGITEQEVRDIFAARVVPEFKSLYGKDAYDGLLRLMGNKHVSKP